MRQWKRICRTGSPVAWQRGGTRGERFEEASPTGLASANGASLSEASEPQGQEILDTFVAETGYARKYARWLLTHAQEVLTPPAALRQRYMLEVEGALALAWETLGRIGTKRSIPFLPDMLHSGGA